MKYNIGDIVLVKEPGYSYSSYDKKFVELNFKNSRRNEPFDDYSKYNNLYFEIIGITKHEYGLHPLYKIVNEDEDHELLVSEHGIKLAARISTIKLI